MGGRRIYHARGKVLGGSSSINGMIFQRGNPMDYERWAGDQGLETGTTCTACPTSSGWRPCSSTAAQADAWRGGSGPLVLERGPATNPLFGAFFEAAQQAGYPLTDDVNGYRQEGFARFDRNVHRRSPALRGPRLPAPGHGPQEPPRRDAGAGHQGPLRRQARHRGRVPPRRPGAPLGQGGRGDPLRRGDQHPPAAPALRHRRPEHLQPLGVRMVHDLPGVGENLQDHLEVYIQYASKLPVSIAPGLAWHRRPGIGYEWLFHRRGLGATNHFEGGGFARSNEDVDWPEPDVPLPADRRSATTAPRRPRATATRCTSARCTPTPAAGCGSRARDPKQHPKMLFNYLSTPNDRASGSRRSGSRATSSTSRRSRRSTAASSRRDRRSRPTRRSSTGSARTPRRRCTPRARRRWASTTCP